MAAADIQVIVVHVPVPAVPVASASTPVDKAQLERVELHLHRDASRRLQEVDTQIARAVLRRLLDTHCGISSISFDLSQRLLALVLPHPSDVSGDVGRSKVFLGAGWVASVKRVIADGDSDDAGETCLVLVLSRCHGRLG